MNNGKPITEGHLFSVRKYVFSGWFFSILIHSILLLVILPQLIGRMNLSPSSQHSKFRQAGIMLLPAETDQKNKKTGQSLDNHDLDELKKEQKTDTPIVKPIIEPEEVVIPEKDKSQLPKTIVDNQQLKTVENQAPSDVAVPVKPVQKDSLSSKKKTASTNKTGSSNSKKTSEASVADLSEGDTSGALEKDETVFFGLKDKGERFVYLIDVSASMDGIAIERVKREMIASLKHLKSDQYFQIYFFNRKIFDVKIRSRKNRGMFRADIRNKEVANKVINAIQTDGGTHYIPVLRKAVELSPDVIFILTDAGEPVLSVGELNELKKLNKGLARIHTIEFGKNPETKKYYNFLKRLAKQSHGRYRYYHINQ